MESPLWETAKVPLKKREIFGCFERHLSFWVSGVELPLIFFLYKKKEKKLNTKYMTKLFFSYWLNKKEYIFDKLNITWLWVLVINYQIITWFFCPSYNLPKNKKKDKAQIYLSKITKFRARLWNRNVLGTHSAQIESDLLNSNDQYTLFAWYEWYVEHTWQTLTEINSGIFILWMYPFF